MCVCLFFSYLRGAGVSMVLRMAKGDNHYAGHVDDDGGGWWLVRDIP